MVLVGVRGGIGSPLACPSGAQALTQRAAPLHVACHDSSTRLCWRDARSCTHQVAGAHALLEMAWGTEP